jgi:hypothetical protein
MITKRKLTTLGLVLVISFASLGFACDKDKARELSKGVDTIAEAELRVANFMKEAKETGTLSQEDINAIKPYLIAVNDANRNAIATVKQIGTDPTADQKTQLLREIAIVANAINSLNQQGLLRIKDPQKKLVFTTLVTTLQGTISTVTAILFTVKENR